MNINSGIISLWTKKTLIFHLSIMEIKMRYKESFLSFLWVILEPLFMFIILYIVFSNIREPREENFAIYLISGIIFYHLFTKGTMTGLTSIRNNQGILKSLSINKNIFPIIAVTTTALLLIVEIVIFFGIMPFVSFVPSWTLIMMPFVIILLLVLILGLSYLLSVLYVKIPDIQPIWTILMYALLFVSPIFWSIDEANDTLLTIQQINPLGQIIELSHKIVFNEVPIIEDWIKTSLIVSAILIVGYTFFRKFEKTIVEEL